MPRALKRFSAASPTFGRQRFVQELSDLLRQNAFSEATSETGRVRVVSAEQVRILDIPHLFLAGLSERSFPRRRNDDCLYSESDREQLNEHGLTLAPHSQRAQEEMLMFYNVVTRARRSLVLSYPVVNPAGEPLSPSPYLAALRDLFEPEALKEQVEEQLDPIPRRNAYCRWPRPAGSRDVRCRRNESTGAAWPCAIPRDRGRRRRTCLPQSG